MKIKVLSKKDFKKVSKPKKYDDRDRNFFCEVYYDRELLKCLLIHYSKDIKRWAFATHDKDVKSDGTLKVAHTHVYLEFYNKKSLLQVRELLKADNQNVLAQVSNNRVGSLQYLIHRNAPEKFQYDPDIVTCSPNFDYDIYLDVTFTPREKSLSAMAEALLNGVSVLELMHTYGDYFIINYHKLKELVIDLRSEQINRKIQPLKSTPMELEEIYIIDKNGEFI